MGGLTAILRKELADHFGSLRFIILYALICLAGAWAVYGAGETIRNALSSTPPFAFLLLFSASGENGLPFLQFVGFLGPLVGLALAFDSINSERNRGTMSRLLAQPIYRDAVINGKFLAGLTTVSLMLASITVVVSGLGVRLIGLVPSPEELLRVVAFMIVCILYVAFWMALATLFSLLFRQAVTSALAGIAIWIFFYPYFFFGMIASSMTNAFVSVNEMDPINSALNVYNVQQMVQRISPTTLFQEASVAILMPNVRSLGIILPWEQISMVPNPLPLTQSLLMVWPQVVGLLALTVICFAIAYTKFMTEEIRAL